VPGIRDLLVAVVALGLLWALNTGADVVQQRWFPDLWAADHRITDAIAAGLSPARAVLLGLSAGIGEEITLRGGLQPRLGIPLTAAFFAALHVQYSWFGMLVIFVLGLLLGAVRKRTNTSVAILAHIAYDVLAVLGGK
jgi:membrane protease YdiL (CAAX protease family)